MRPAKVLAPPPPIWLSALPMKEILHYRTILRRVGVVLVAAGVMDIIFASYFFVIGMSYVPRFNILAIGAGMVLLLGKLKIVRWASLFISFLLLYAAGAWLIESFLVPRSLLWAYVRLQPGYLVMSSIPALLLLALLAWVHRTLTGPVIEDAMLRHHVPRGRFWMRPSFGFWMALLVLAGFAMMHVRMAGGPKARRACEMAATVTGPGYRYYVNSIALNLGLWPGPDAAVVTAYGAKDIRRFPVKWDDSNPPAGDEDY